ncbi:hypothetical protein [Budvicia aquatica]|uniref:hypothetical protein n=1 Tax=Budvicia aquatica TaxID=82979 RepID=UPI0020824E1A|nr:hypothetical protein [Budvicia aquatica]GKX52137.1 hypothetical protein SOASR029_24460 [Budvicia aquatica]
MYLGYGLTQLDAFVEQSVILDNNNATDNALEQTSKLAMLSGTVMDISGNSQTVCCY